MPHGLLTKISSRPSPSKSPSASNRLSPVLSSQPPKRVPFCAITGAASVFPDHCRMPMPHGLLTKTSERRSPSKSASLTAIRASSMRPS
jgi:hypothetical protein